MGAARVFDRQPEQLHGADSTDPAEQGQVWIMQNNFIGVDVSMTPTLRSYVKAALILISSGTAAAVYNLRDNLQGTIELNHAGPT